MRLYSYLFLLKSSLFNAKIVSLTYSQDHKYKIFNNCPTECYQYCIFMAPRTATSLAGWISVPIHAPDCACRSLALALCISFLQIKEFIERKPVSLKFRRACAVLSTRWPPSLSSHLAPFPLGPFPPRPSPPSGNCRKAVGNVRKAVGDFRKAVGPEVTS